MLKWRVSGRSRASTSGSICQEYRNNENDLDRLHGL